MTGVYRTVFDNNHTYGNIWFGGEAYPNVYSIITNNVMKPAIGENAVSIWAIYKIVKNKEWQGFKDVSHLYLFNPDSLKFLVERAGFTIEKIETPFYTLPNFIQKFANITHKGGQIWLVAKKD